MASIHLQAIQMIEANNWHAAHQLIQTAKDPLACLIHGFLHRQEGDQQNAHYWYKRAGESMPENDLQLELERLSALAKR